MRRASIPSALVVLFLTAACASSGDRANLLDPEIRIVQMPGTTFAMRYSGRLTIRYAMEIRNVSSEEIRLRRVQLRIIGEGPYALQRDAIPIPKTIAPNSSEIVEFDALAFSYGGTVESREPLALRGIAHFESDEGAFRTTFTQVIIQPDDTAPR